jgi:hypothetical protein
VRRGACCVKRQGFLTLVRPLPAPSPYTAQSGSRGRWQRDMPFRSHGRTAPSCRPHRSTKGRHQQNRTAPGCVDDQRGWWESWQCPHAGGPQRCVQYRHNRQDGRRTNAHCADVDMSAARALAPEARPLVAGLPCVRRPFARTAARPHASTPVFALSRHGLRLWRGKVSPG